MVSILSGLGVLGFLSWAMSSLWAQIEWFAAQGWAAVTLLGIASACLISFFVSLSLFAWRWFHPLGNTSQAGAELASPADPDPRVTALLATSALVRLEHQIDELQANIDAQFTVVADGLQTLSERHAAAQVSDLGSVRSAPHNAHSMNLETLRQMLQDLQQEVKTQLGQIFDFGLSQPENWPAHHAVPGEIPSMDEFSTGEFRQLHYQKKQFLRDLASTRELMASQPRGPWIALPAPPPKTRN